MTIRMIDGIAYAEFIGVGLLPVQGSSPEAARELQMVVTAARVAGQAILTVPGLKVVPILPAERPIGFRL